MSGAFLLGFPPSVAIHTQNVLSLCSGVGGLELGLAIARPDIRTVCYVEREAYAAAILVARMEEAQLDAAPIWSDLQTFNTEPWLELVDGIVGGFPCQPWSVAGRRKEAEDERWLWPDIVRVVRELEPSWCFFENVPGLIRRGLPIVLGDLAALGFDAEWGVFSAQEVGAPHLRRRLYILAHARRWRDDEDQYGRQQWPGGQGEAGTGIARAAVEQSAGNRWRKGRTEHELWGGQDATADSGLSVGYANHTGLQGWSRPITGSTNELPTWPPSPTADERWPEGLEPAVCRMADGLAYRVDRLRACGNGVVPLAAANAYRILRARIEA